MPLHLLRMVYPRAEPFVLNVSSILERNRHHPTYRTEMCPNREGRPTWHLIWVIFLFGVVVSP
jgi:hypothetical protein